MPETTKSETRSYTCPNCGGKVEKLKDARGNIGACKECLMSVDLDALEKDEPYPFIGHTGTAPAVKEGT